MIFVSTMDKLIQVRLGIVLVASLLISAAACSSDKYQNIKPVSTDSCSTANLGYAADIKPILEAQCYNCHADGTSSSGGGIVLDNYNAAKALRSSIIERVTLPNSDSWFMPQGGGSIGTCKISKIQAWIDQGANP